MKMTFSKKTRTLFNERADLLTFTYSKQRFLDIQGSVKEISSKFFSTLPHSPGDVSHATSGVLLNKLTMMAFRRKEKNSKLSTSRARLPNMHSSQIVQCPEA